MDADPRQFWEQSVERLEDELAHVTGPWAECMAKIQSHTVQLALDLIVREADIDGFFRAFTRSLMEMAESQVCGVWLLDDEGEHCDLWMAYIGEKLFTKGGPDWDSLTLPREEMASHLFAYKQGWTETTEYSGEDERLPESVRAFNRSIGLAAVAITPMAPPSRNHGKIALSTGDAPAEHAPWRCLLLEATARQATLALHQSRLAEQSRVEARRQAVLEERNRIARDIHDTLAQGFAAILMQLQSAQRAAGSVPPTLRAASRLPSIWRERT